MLNSKSQTAERLPAASVAGAGAGGPQAALLAGLDCVLVNEPVHAFPGALERGAVLRIWGWIERDVSPDSVVAIARDLDAGTQPLAALDAHLPAILADLKAVLAAEAEDGDRARRQTIQMGGEEVRSRLPFVVTALRRRQLLEQGAVFGRALGTVQDEAALGEALQSITLSNPVTRALWMQAMVSRMVNPSRVLAAVARIAGGAEETHIVNAGYGALVEAVLAHAQDQLSLLDAQPGIFSDYDLACKAIDRFHRLVRALNYTLEINRKSAWGSVITDLTARISERLERPLYAVSADVTHALRRPREGADRIDPDRVLGALNGLYLLVTVRNSRDSLAVNALIDQVWTDTGQALEVLVARALDAFRAQPGDAIARARIDAGIKMAEIRFNIEYADILRRARDGADRRIAAGG